MRDKQMDPTPDTKPQAKGHTVTHRNCTGCMRGRRTCTAYLNAQAPHGAGLVVGEP